MNAYVTAENLTPPEQLVEQQASLLRAMAQRMLEAPRRLLEHQEGVLALIKNPVLQGEDLSAAFCLLTETAARLMQVSRVGVWRYTHMRDAIECVALYQSHDHSHGTGEILRAGDFPAYFEALAVSQAICADDASNDGRTREFRDSYLEPKGIRSMMDIPLIVFGRLEGVICHEQVGSQRLWSPEDRLLGIALANLAALAIERAERRSVAQRQSLEDARTRSAIEERLRQSEERYRTLVNGLKLVVFETDIEGRWTFLNPAWEALSGHAVGDSLAHEVGAYVHLQDRATCQEVCRSVLEQGKDHSAQFRLMTREGAERWVEIVAWPQFAAAGHLTGCSGTIADITARRAAESYVQRLAYHDELTGLPNRTLLFDRLDRALVDARRNSCCVAVLFLDLDNFKRINDTLGHVGGDDLLMQVGHRLRALLRQGDTVARYGGDEFLLVVRDFKSHDDACEVAAKAVHAVARPFMLNGHAYTVTASIGISIYPHHAAHRDVLLKHADMALYQAKRNGGNTYSVFALA